MTPRTSESVLLVVASVISAIVTVYAAIDRHMSITAEDFVLFLLVTVGASFTVKTIAAVIWHVIRQLRRNEP
jgi:hypothetical protein